MQWKQEFTCISCFYCLEGYQLFLVLYSMHHLSSFLTYCSILPSCISFFYLHSLIWPNTTQVNPRATCGRHSRRLRRTPQPSSSLMRLMPLPPSERRYRKYSLVALVFTAVNGVLLFCFISVMSQSVSSCISQVVIQSVSHSVSSSTPASSTHPLHNPRLMVRWSAASCPSS